ncbi:hypothetical protein [Micromonospora robiginosa]|uniref:Uncharacterized protein n=1 Tax=Micromonospora robiginosa TaxID=2749844 RepID=A0A7L6B0A7_9ACTN|nr:hypothetical protein [Micromonospora ferruginea]QLQ35324.1 hypothetical protein H1D33_18190 [Micromonospora ferruginea]
MTCGFYNLGTYWRDDGSGLYYNDWANSATTHGNSMTVYNWDGSKWVDWGTVPAWSVGWQFKLVNQIDGVRINC